MKSIINKEIFDKTLESMASVIEAIDASSYSVNDDGAPLVQLDKNPEALQKVISDHARTIKACYACIEHLAKAHYDHVDRSKHLDPAKNWDHKQFMQKTLGFDKEDSIRRAAYS